MLALEHPELLLLAVPAIWAYVKWGHQPGGAGYVRIALVVLLLVAQPVVRQTVPGTHLVVVADRSKSMPPESEARIKELIRLTEAQRGTGGAARAPARCAH